MNLHRRSLLVFVILAVVATACRRPVEEVELGIQRIALSLAFSEEELKEPVEPEVIIKVIPAPPQIRQPEDLIVYQVQPGTTPPETFDITSPCPEAPPGAAPKDPVELQTFFPPEEGIYQRWNKGTLSIVGGVLPLTLPYPPISTWTIEHQEPVVTEGIDGLTEDTVEATWTIRKAVTPTFVITDHLRLRDANIALIERVTEVNGVVTTFAPTPPVNLYVFGVEGDSWTSAGIDADTNTALYVSGEITQREIVDACGDLVDTYQFTLEEQFVNLDTGETSGTPLGEPNTYNIATQDGGLIVKEIVHTISTTQTEDGTPLTIELNYESRFNTLSAEPLPASPEDGS